MLLFAQLVIGGVGEHCCEYGRKSTGNRAFVIIKWRLWDVSRNIGKLDTLRGERKTRKSKFALQRALHTTRLQSVETFRRNSRQQIPC
jgi:hypothetical protein